MNTRTEKGNALVVMILFLCIGVGFGYWLMHYTGTGTGGNNSGTPAVSVAPELKTVRNGDILALQLEANTTTGYQWTADYDTAYLQLVEKRYEPGNVNRVGAGGLQIFTFLALQPGETTVTFAYRRIWEKNENALKLSVYKIIID